MHLSPLTTDRNGQRQSAQHSQYQQITDSAARDGNRMNDGNISAYEQQIEDILAANMVLAFLIAGDSLASAEIGTQKAETSNQNVKLRISDFLLWV